jgi:hypothetical protein
MISDPEIAIDYTITYQEFVAGLKLGWRQSFSTLVLYAFARYLAPTVALFFFVLVVFDFSTGLHEAGWQLLPVPLLLLSIPLFMTFNWRGGYRRLKVSKTSEPQMSFTANQREFARQIHGMGELTWFWSATKGFAQNKKAVLIVVRKGAFIIIPRRALTEAQIERLRVLQKGPK